MRTPSRTRAIMALAFVPLLTLAACNSKPTVIQAQDDSDDMKTAVANAAPVIGEPRARQVIAAAWKLDTLSDVGEIVRLCA